MSKEKAARIANTKKPGKKGGNAKKYEERTKEELVKQAKKIDIKNLNKTKLINAMRKH